MGHERRIRLHPIPFASVRPTQLWIASAAASHTYEAAIELDELARWCQWCRDPDSLAAH
jgi:hypothetical protein